MEFAHRSFCIRNSHISDTVRQYFLLFYFFFCFTYIFFLLCRILFLLSLSCDYLPHVLAFDSHLFSLNNYPAEILSTGRTLTTSVLKRYFTVSVSGPDPYSTCRFPNGSKTSFHRCSIVNSSSPLAPTCHLHRFKQVSLLVLVSIFSQVNLDSRRNYIGYLIQPSNSWQKFLTISLISLATIHF